MSFIGCQELVIKQIKQAQDGQRLCWRQHYREPGIWVEDRDVA